MKNGYEELARSVSCFLEMNSHTSIEILTFQRAGLKNDHTSVEHVHIVSGEHVHIVLLAATGNQSVEMLSNYMC
jgi:hypothetical protein